MATRELTEAAQTRFAGLALLPLELVGPPTGRFSGFRALGEVWRSRRLLAMFVKRDIKAKYKDSVFGIFWTLIRPLVQLLVFYLVIGKFLGAERGIPLFAVYIFTGLTAWGLFSEIITSGTASIVGSSGIVKKIYLPRELFPLSAVGVALFNFVIQLLILVVAALLLRPGLDVANLTYFVPSVLLLILFGSGTAIALSALNVQLRDIQYLVEVALMILMWASPIMYGWSMAASTLQNPITLGLYTANPVTLAVLGFQVAFWDSPNTPAGMFPDNLMPMLWIAVFASIVYFLICQRIFARYQGSFAQAI